MWGRIARVYDMVDVHIKAYIRDQLFSMFSDIDIIKMSQQGISWNNKNEQHACIC